MKMKKRGLSSTIATVLIVLMAILGAVIVWAYIRSSVTDSSERVEMQEKCYTITTELQDCIYDGLSSYWFATGLVKLSQGESTELRVAFYSENGTSVIKNLEPINVLETKKILPPTVLPEKPEYAIASPIVYNRDKSENLVCPISKKMVCNEVTFPGNLCEIPTSVEDVTPFVWALVDSINYTESFPNCPNSSADFNCDGTLNAFDISSFVTIMQSGWVLCNQSMICDYSPSPGNQTCWDSQESLDYCNTTLCT
jgi:hypothetical protein